MNTNAFITDRCELSSLGLVASLKEPAFGWTTPPPQREGLKILFVGRVPVLNPAKRWHMNTSASTNFFSRKETAQLGDDGVHAVPFPS